ncbi:adenine deaminase C-terminal domain-containing protein [Halobacillus amylolyticus]|uniref:adenine deaminase n=1 Tax=Halobacillus amylolyticus TaxID=2932259 RepID=A0ABY4H6X4_9BACI|nr:adenine deaminase C-terminal domain-containing protein [Halobacillus amylolyticus]UOR10198.1 amidohydrolase family protein [Halobacillus amylolyticus]
MNEQRFRWRNRQLREHVAVVEGKLAPTKLVKNTTYLNVYLKQWMTGHIWIYEDRIIYSGPELPPLTEGTEIIDGQGSYIVPGYVEPHVHPYQLYNPLSLAVHAVQTGTTTLINDNLMWIFLTDKKKAFSLLEDCAKLSASVFWWARFDSQSALQEEDQFDFDDQVLSWLNHDAVIQGGELTAWPDVLYGGDDQMLHWMQESKRSRKPLEGHLPGASWKTLVKMKLLGLDSEHESMTADEVMDRLMHGYQTGLRYSSIRPDLPDILKGLKEKNLTHFDKLMYTTDGSTPGFFSEGLINVCIKIAIEAGIPEIDAYLMGSYQPARHFGLEDRIGSLASGRVAHLNFLSDPTDPTPHSVIAKGEWVKRDHNDVARHKEVHWEENGVAPLDINWELTADDLQFSMPIGMEMVNEVIMKPYAIDNDASVDRLPPETREAFLTLLDRDGKWQVNTLLKGFTDSLGGLVSSYSNTGDFILIGNSREDTRLAFERMKELGGGIVLADQGEIVYELPLPLGGIMADMPMSSLIEEEHRLREHLNSYGYVFGDPVYTLLFLSSMHLPYIRITPKGIMDVKKKEVLYPAMMR